LLTIRTFLNGLITYGRYGSMLSLAVLRIQVCSIGEWLTTRFMICAPVIPYQS
jgi:hypothetical protein